MEHFSIPTGDPLNSDYVDSLGQPAYHIDTTSRSGGVTNISRFVRTQNGVVQPVSIAQIEWHRFSADIFRIGDRVLEDGIYIPAQGSGRTAKRRNRTFVSANRIQYHWSIDRAACQLTTAAGAAVGSFTSSGISRLFGVGNSHLDVSRDVFNDLDEIVITAAFVAKCIQRKRAAVAAAGAGATA